MVLILRILVLNTALFLSAQIPPPIVIQDIPALAPSQNIVEDPEAASTFKEIVDVYRQNQQKRREDQRTDIFLQEDLDIFKNFISENSHTEAALTTKLLIANLLFMDANIVDFQFPRNIYKDIAQHYSDKWQGKIASSSLLALKIYEDDSDCEKTENLVAKREEAKKMLEIAQYLDDSTKLDIQAYCSLDSHPRVYSVLSSIAIYSKRLGEYEMAKEYYKKIMHLYPGTWMASDAENSLHQIQSNLDGGSNQQTTDKIPESTTLTDNIVPSAGETNTVVTDTQKQAITTGKDTTLSKGNTTPQPWECNSKHVTIAVAAVAFLILTGVVSLVFWGIRKNRKQ